MLHPPWPSASHLAAAAPPVPLDAPPGSLPPLSAHRTSSASPLGVRSRLARPDHRPSSPRIA
jgi:hypothetical protein